MKKKINLFSSALAIGILLGASASSLLEVSQHRMDSTITAHATTESSNVQVGTTVSLTNDQITLTDEGYISQIDWRDNQKAALAANGTLEIPAKGSDGKNITGIGNGGIFARYNLQENGDGIKQVRFTIPSNIKYIGDSAFMDNQLTDIDLPKVETISKNAFRDNQLTNLVLPKVKTIDAYAFRRNKLSNIELPVVKMIGDNTFDRNELTTVKLSDVRLVGERAFVMNKIKKVEINQNHAYDDNAEFGTLQNPDYRWDAFESQNWGTLEFPYQQEISYQNLVNAFGLVFQINDRNFLDKTHHAKSLVNLDENIENISNSAEQEVLNVDSKNGGNASISVELLTKIQENHLNFFISGLFNLTVNAKNENLVPNPPLPNPENNTSQPDNGNETKPNPAPLPEKQGKRPHTVYDKRGMRLHRNVSLTSPIKSYKKQSRAKAPSFRVRGIAYDKNGKKRYKVDGGYVTAGSSYVADSHFRSNKVRQVRVLSNRVNSYKDVKLSSNKKVRSYKKGTKLKVKRIVNYGRATRFELTNGRYITGNKQLLIMDQQ